MSLLGVCISEEWLIKGLDLNNCKPSVANEVIPVLGNALDILTDILSKQALASGSRAYQ